MRSTRSPSWTDRLLGLDPIPAPPHAFSLDADGLTRAAFQPTETGHWRLEGPVRTPATEAWLEPGHLGGLPKSEAALQRMVAGSVEGASRPLKSASLVLPDSWMRLAFTESPELPRALRAREEIVAFKLKRLVPFRVEDLRIGATEVTPLADQSEPCRLLLGFSTELLVRAVEDAFERVGVQLGRITNRSLALAAALEPVLPSEGLGALLIADGGGFSLTVLHRGEPLLQRRKENTGPGPAVDRELRLTRTFLADRFPGEAVSRCFVAVPAEELPAWQELLRGTLDVEPEPLSTSLLPLTGPIGGVDRTVTAMLYGVVRVEVT